MGSTHHEGDTVTEDIAPPSAEETAWLRRMEALEDGEPFPGVGCRPPHRAQRDESQRGV